ncbi:MAG: hypothetical protein JWN98_1525, partial [Abditibacteriota bacterium]|nr:hypothetical protein [Abditibacteriota bacterium]
QPPVGLLTRILQACRIAALLSERRSFPARRSSGSERDTANPSASASAIPDVSHLPLGGFEWDNEWTPLPPSNLQDSILRLTTRRTEELAVSEVPLMMEVPHVCDAAGRPLLAPRRMAPRINWSSWTRHAAAIAVPAMLIWMVMAPEIAMAPRDTAPAVWPAPRGSSLDATQRVTSDTPAPRMAANVERNLHVAARPLTVATAPKPIKAASENEVPANTTVVRPQPAPDTTFAVASTGRAQNMEQASHVAMPAFQLATLSNEVANSPSAPLRTSYLNARAHSSSSQPASLSSRRTANGPRPRISVGYARRAIGSPSGAVKSSLAANAAEVRPSLIGVVTPLHRAESATGTSSLAAPRIAAVRAAAPVASSEPREPALDMHEALAEAPTWGDSRPDDIRDVVDAYAAALISDDTEGDLAETSS